MARPKIIRGTYINILLGNGAGPEVFTPICGITTRNFTDQINTASDFVRDCAVPTDVPAREVSAVGEQWDLTGSGLLDRNNLATLQAALGVVKNYRYEIGQPAGDAVYGGYYAGAAMMTRLQITGDDGRNVGVDLTFESNGKWVWTVVP